MSAHAFRIQIEVDTSSHPGPHTDPTSQLSIEDETGADGRSKHSKVKDGDSFVWCSNSGTLKVSFADNDHPFISAPQTPVSGGHCTTQVNVIPNAEIKEYKYTVTVTEPNQPAHFEDPRIWIDPGGGAHTIQTIAIIVAVLLALTGALVTWRKWKSGVRTS